MEAERVLLADTLGLLEAVCPTMAERALLADALRDLDELFLLVVVGEFNSGKSSVRPHTLSAKPVILCAYVCWRKQYCPALGSPDSRVLSEHPRNSAPYALCLCCR